VVLPVPSILSVTQVVAEAVRAGPAAAAPALQALGPAVARGALFATLQQTHVGGLLRDVGAAPASKDRAADAALVVRMEQLQAQTAVLAAEVCALTVAKAADKAACERACAQLPPRVLALLHAQPPAAPGAEAGNPDDLSRRSAAHLRDVWTMLLHAFLPPGLFWGVFLCVCILYFWWVCFLGVFFVVVVGCFFVCFFFFFFSPMYTVFLESFNMCLLCLKACLACIRSRSTPLLRPSLSPCGRNPLTRLWFFFGFLFVCLDPQRFVQDVRDVVRTSLSAFLAAEQTSSI
jgi:hypothetical protein